MRFTIPSLPRSPFTPRSRSSTFSSGSGSTVSVPVSVSAGQPMLFCASCVQTLSSSCLVSGAHRDHRLLELQDAVQLRVENMMAVSKKLASNTKKCGDIRPRIEAAERELEDMCQRTEELLNHEYRTLSELLDHNKQKAFLLLNNHKEAVKQQLHQLNEDTQNFNDKSTRMVEDIQQLRNRQENENSASLLGEISALETSLATMNEFYSTVNDKLKLDRSRLEALENSVKKIVEKNKEILPRPWEFLEEITLDDSRKQGNVKISEDKTELWAGPRSGVPGSAMNSAWCRVLAAQSFKQGQHYWEVSVAGSKSWAVGVTERSQVGKHIRSEALGHDKSLWVLECSEGELSALHNEDYVTLKDSDVHTLGVFVDCDKGRLKFYNVSTGTVLYTFVAKFRRPVCPFFSVQAQKETDARLKICSLIDRDSANYESDIDSQSAYNSS